MILTFIFQANLKAQAQGCGTLLTTYVKLQPDGKAMIDDFFLSSDEYCDSSLGDINSNFKIVLLESGKVLAKKNVFISQNIYEENFDKTGVIKNSPKLSQSNIFSLIKFPVKKNHLTKIQYSITKLSDGKLVGEGELALEKNE